MPLIELSGSTADELHAAIVATCLMPDPADRADRKWLADGLYRLRIGQRARALADEGHDSAALMAQIAVGSPYDKPADSGTIRDLLKQRRRSLLLAAHVTAVLLIA